MESLADEILGRGLLSAADLTRAAEVQARTGGRLAVTLVRLGLIAEDEMASLLSERCALPLASADTFPENAQLLERLNPRFLARRSIVPIGRDGDTLRIAMADPEDDDARTALAFATRRRIAPRVATFSDIADFLARYATPFADQEVGDVMGAGAMGDVERLIEDESDAPIIRTVHRLIADAARRRASDVHIEPMARYVGVRYRIDGRLNDVERLPDQMAGPLARRVKVMAGLDIAEARLPQDGRLRVAVRGREIDVRVSTSPTAWGESIVLRLLARNEVPLDLEQLGLPAPALAGLSDALKRPHGIILLTGPTGSGKTTTLYAALNRLRRPEVKILTVEDPVEILLEGINQVQVRPEIDLSYAATLRAFLRQDPDILMIGEIRDQETAEIAMRAALTGHLVLSTLHTNSAIGAFTRLADIGVEPYLTASTVIASVAQRLIRSLCEACKQSRPITEQEAALFVSADLSPPAQIHDTVGCAQCQLTGYAGRLPLIEIVEVDDDLRSRIRTGNAELGYDRRPRSTTLFGHGLILIAAGRTTFPEVERAVHLS